MVTEIWTPPGVTLSESSQVGMNTETGSSVYKYSFRVYDEVTKRRHEFQVLVDDDTTRSQVEEMVGNAMESWLIDVRMRHSKPAPTPEQRKEIGRILEDIRVHRNKRKESSNRRIYYDSLW
jgi:hypothetical protein